MTEIKFRKKTAKLGKRRIIEIPKTLKKTVEEAGELFDITLVSVSEGAQL